MSTQNAVAVMIYDRLGKALNDFFQLGEDCDLSRFVNLPPTGSLLDQLTNGPKDAPPKVTLGLVIDFVGDSVSALLKGLATPSTTPIPLLPLAFFPLSPDLLGRLRNLFEAELTFFKDQKNFLINIITSVNTRDRQDAAKGLFTDSTFFSDGLRQLIGDEIGAIFSLATIGNALQGAPLANVGQVPADVEKALLEYFFKKKGYENIDGSNVVAPVHLSDILADPVPDDLKSISNEINQLKSHFSNATAEQYVRDIIRVIVEAAYDTARDLRKKYDGVRDKVRKLNPTPPLTQADVEKKFVNWFKGFSAMAESAAMRAVETATRGVSEFQTNTLIAAAAGTFAGTVARKLAQDSFLTVLQSDLNS
ncbi:MAG: hypothetical protein ABSG91_08025 [Syntrophobacteraceae bacterium]